MMKALRVFAMAVLILASAGGSALTQDRLVSGEPRPGFFEGVLIPADGPATAEIVGHGASGSTRVVRPGIRITTPDEASLAEILPEAFIGIPESLVEGEAAAVARNR